MYITPQTVISCAALLAALVALIGYYNKAYRWVQRQNAQDADLKSVRAEQTILMKGILACLQGLAEQGCDGPVHKAIDEINAYLISK